MKNAYRIVVRNPKGKIPLGRSRLRLDHDIKMNLMEMLWEGAI
jgi:hypothetical protein